VVDHVAAIDRHVGVKLMDVALANDRLDVDFSAAPSGVGDLVCLSNLQGARLVTSDLIDVEHPWRHDSRKLARAVMDVYAQLGGQAGAN
jgi:hypothetical protein